MSFFVGSTRDLSVTRYFNKKSRESLKKVDVKLPPISPSNKSIETENKGTSRPTSPINQFKQNLLNNNVRPGTTNGYSVIKIIPLTCY